MAGSRESLSTPASSGAGDRHLAARKQRRRVGRAKLAASGARGVIDRGYSEQRMRRGGRRCRRFYCRASIEVGSGAAYGVGVAAAHGRDSEVSRMDSGSCACRPATSACMGCHWAMEIAVSGIKRWAST